MVMTLWGTYAPRALAIGPWAAAGRAFAASPIAMMMLRTASSPAMIMALTGRLPMMRAAMSQRLAVLPLSMTALISPL